MKSARLAAAAAALILLTPTGVDAKPATCRDYVDLARSVGFPKSERGNIRRIMYRESRCRPDAINWADPHGASWGLMQINASNLGYLTRQGIADDRYDLLNPRVNMRAAFALWDLYGWRPWRGSSTTPLS
jgi:soluble lytic murein transglycosylase-like protein